MFDPVRYLLDLMLLLPRIGQIIELHSLAVAVDPGADWTETIEASPSLAICLATELPAITMAAHTEQPAGCGGDRCRSRYRW
jgi:hypothetical protein